jgi:hypothetical protein
MIKFGLGDTQYEYDDGTMTVAEARIIKKHAGMGLRSWAMALQDMDPDALVGLVFLAKRRSGEAVRWQDLDNLDIAAISIVDATEDDVDADPPAPATTLSSTSGTTRKRSTTKA